MGDIVENVLEFKGYAEIVFLVYHCVYTQSYYILNIWNAKFIIAN